MINKESVIILGSKPEATFPDIKVENVLAANGAVELALLYREKYGANIIVLVPSNELLKHKHIQESFVKGKPDEIVLLGEESEEATDLIKNVLNLNAEIIIFNPNERLELMKKILGYRRYILLVKRTILSGPRKLFSGSSLWPSCSTGLNAIFYAMVRFPEAEKYITAGIGLKSGGHFNKVGEFTDKTSQSDLITIKHWPYIKRKNVYTTDDVMSEIGGVPKWEGEILQND